MGKAKYLIRLDDACPRMDTTKWDRMERMLDKYEIRPLVGIIPNNEDPETIKQNEDHHFWEKARKWEEKQWMIALHGYNHCCRSMSGGINPVHKRSEFASLDLEEQKKKISAGYQVLVNNGINPIVFFAPSHTYDANTILALEECTPIRVISDTFTRFPYSYHNTFTIIPCQMGKWRQISISGYWTFCLHPNNMNNEDFLGLEKFLLVNKDSFVSVRDVLRRDVHKISIVDMLLQKAYLYFRALLSK